MKKILLSIFLLIMMASCKNMSKQETKSSKEIVLQEIIPKMETLQEGCYTYQDTKDTIQFEITDVESGIKGKLTYALGEKDKNTGTFIGVLDENHLFGVYTFLSEGIESKREIAFMVQDNQLIEGYGELNSEGNGFKNRNEISYTSKMPLSKTDCKSVDNF